MVQNFIHIMGLKGLEKKGKNYNFRCPVCGDSQKSATKKRGWFLNKNGKWNFYCHNCGESSSFRNFLKKHYPHLYKDYLKTVFKEGRKSLSELQKKEVKKNNNDFELEKLDIPTLITFDSSHPAMEYFNSRKFPSKIRTKLHYTDNFMKWINSKLPDKFEKYPKSDPRIVIPYYTRHGKIFCVQGRALTDDSSLRYITIKFSEHEKIFGLESVDFSKRDVYVHEGAFDSYFLPNSIAMGGADLNLDYLKSLTNMEKYVFVFDNEPRNPEMLRRIETILKDGFRVALLPTKYKHYGKDLNKLIQNGLSPKEVKGIVDSNTFKGMVGMVKFKTWTKTNYRKKF